MIPVVVLLVGCTGGGKPADDTSQGSGPPGDASSESDSVGDTTDTSGGTASGAPERGSVPPDAWHRPWLPGDDIPGWDDYACPTPSGHDAVEIRWPDLALLELTMLDGVGWGGPHEVTLQLRDCVNFACGADDLDRSVPHLEVVGDATFGDAGETRGQGAWGPDESGGRHVAGSGTGLVGAWSNGADGTWMSTTVCFSRLRPDEVSGAVWTEVPLPSTFYTMEGWYPSMYFVYPFSVRFPAHAGFDRRLPDTGDPPPGFSAAHIFYDVDYDDAWPWDEITDPSVKRRVYERYSPYNGE